MSGSRFDVAVVGRGLIGSAAGRHLAEAGLRVAVVGPDEPADWAAWDGPFSSHGDEGRITRLSDRDPVWAEAAARSIERYADIEARSGIEFHRACGLAISTGELEDWVEHGRSVGADVEPIDSAELARTTGITLAAGAGAVLEGPPAGRINPRRLVAAQTLLARRAGASIVAEPAESIESIEPTGAGDGAGFEVGGRWGSVRARRVLVATGAFGAGLIGTRLPLVRRPRTVVLAEVSGNGDGPEPADLPSLILRPPPDPRLLTLYWVPPVEYPDGRTWLKLGGTLAPDPSIGDGPDPDRELVEWFHGQGDPIEVDALEASLRALLPTMTIGATRAVPCVYTGTPSGRPIIDWVDDGIGVAIGGNGSAAKSSDELGRLGAALVGAALVDDGRLGPGPDPAVFARSVASAG